MSTDRLNGFLIDSIRMRMRIRIGFGFGFDFECNFQTLNMQIKCYQIVFDG